MSLPSRERGLKSIASESCKEILHVAPLAGAWIEIPQRNPVAYKISSLPSRERGLKFLTCKTS